MRATPRLARLSIVTLIWMGAGLGFAAPLAAQAECAADHPEVAGQFQALMAVIDQAAVGRPTDCPHVEDSTGDVQQLTSLGLLYWRRDTGIATFTNGSGHVALRGTQRLSWTGDAVDPPADAQAIEVAGVMTETPGATPSPLDRWAAYALVVVAAVYVFAMRAHAELVRRSLAFSVILTLALDLFLYAGPYGVVLNLAGEAWRILPPLRLPIGPVSLGSALPGIDKSDILAWGLATSLAAISLSVPVGVATAAASITRMKETLARSDDWAPGREKWIRMAPVPARLLTNLVAGLLAATGVLVVIALLVFGMGLPAQNGSLMLTSAGGLVLGFGLLTMMAWFNGITRYHTPTAAELEMAYMMSEMNARQREADAKASAKSLDEQLKEDLQRKQQSGL